MRECDLKSTVSGCVIRGLPRSLDRHDPVSIGSDRGSDIVIEGADPHHAELRWDADEEAWFVHDDPAPGQTLRNGTPIDTSRMFDGDELEIAGVHIRFEGGNLREHTTAARLGVSLRDVSAMAGGEIRLQRISFDAAPGTFVSILGPSGCGKSTLIQRIAGLAPYEGGIFFNGHDLRKDAGTLRPLMAYLPQAVEDTLYGDMTVRQSMDNFVCCHLAAGISVDFTKRLEDVDLADKIDEPISKLSGGQKRRFALALALLREPQLLLLDEPTAGLDPAAEADIMRLLRRIADQGRTVLCATHVLGNLNQCDKVLVLANKGRQAFDGTPARALAFFGTNDWCEIYRRLQDGKYYDATNGFDSPPSETELPSAQPRAAFASAFCAMFGRLLRNVISWRNALPFFAIPFGISVVFLFACKSLFEDPANEIGTICFCMVVAMFWLGISGTVRSLVAERVPKRCLDRMRGSPLSYYLAANVAFAAVSSSVQALIFIVPIFLGQLGHSPYSFHAFLPYWLDLSLVGFAGSCVGFAVSAFARTEIKAVLWLPFVAILALFMSKPVLEGPDRDKSSGLLRFVECIMPTLYSQTVLETTMDRVRVYYTDSEKWPPLAIEEWTKRPFCRDKETGCELTNPTTGEPIKGKSWAQKHTDNVLRFYGLIMGYIVVFLSLAFLLQDWRERQWDGR